MSHWIWVLFFILIGLFVALDLKGFQREKKTMSLSQALGLSLFWITLALLFNVAIYFIYEYELLFDTLQIHPKSGHTAAIEFFTGYLLEKSLSLDNIFVISLIFGIYKVPSHLQHRVLMWGILTAAFLRGILILLGVAIVETFSWILYLFGALIIFSGIKLLTDKGIEFSDHSRIKKIVQYFIPLAPAIQGENFFIKHEGMWKMSPLFLAFLQIETADVVFALDSIPAIFAITLDPFIIYTSNIFAIFGLRALYFALAPLIDRFRFIKSSLSLILIYIGIKMLSSKFYEISNLTSLIIIIGLLVGGVVLSMLLKKETST